MMQEQEITIRKAKKKDIPEIIALVRELAVYEKSEDKMTAGQSIYERAFEARQFQAFIAQAESEIIGIAVYYERFSTWKGPILYLEDFIIKEQHRRKGIGKLLFERFVREAHDGSYAMCMWQVLDWNQSAISFYNKYDVQYEDCWLDVKMYFAR
jgi:GNAT superfamily N-acetyltransferase